MKDQRMDEEFNTICFRKKCIKEESQLFFASKYSKHAHEDHEQDFCRKMEPKAFKKLYAIPHSIMTTMITRLNNLMSKHLKEKQEEIGQIFKKGYRAQVRKYSKTYLKQFTYNECQNILKTLRSRSRRSKNQETLILTQLFWENQKSIEKMMSKKLREMTDSFDEVSNKIFASLKQKIQQIFSEMHEFVCIKEEESSQSVYRYNEQDEREMNDPKPLWEKKESSSSNHEDHKESSSQSELASENEEQTPRNRSKNNYFHLHNYGKNIRNVEADYEAQPKRSRGKKH